MFMRLIRRQAPFVGSTELRVHRLTSFKWDKGFFSEVLKTSGPHSILWTALWCGVSLPALPTRSAICLNPLSQTAHIYMLPPTIESSTHSTRSLEKLFGNGSCRANLHPRWS